MNNQNERKETEIIEVPKEFLLGVLQDVCSAKLCEINSMSSRAEMIRMMDQAIAKLKGVLG